jgi:tRNA G10  N-methylase Trm11
VILLDKNIDSIATEWYLGEMMTQKNISFDRIDKQKKSLIELYERFFKWLKEIKYKWNIVICFPFWEIKWSFIYFTEIYDILNKYCNIEQLFPTDFQLETTKFWSLLYKRDKQLVWREIFKLTIK